MSRAMASVMASRTGDSAKTVMDGAAREGHVPGNDAELDEGNGDTNCTTCQCENSETSSGEAEAQKKAKLCKECNGEPPVDIGDTNCTIGHIEGGDWHEEHEKENQDINPENTPEALCTKQDGCCKNGSTSRSEEAEKCFEEKGGDVRGQSPLFSSIAECSTDQVVSCGTERPERDVRKARRWADVDVEDEVDTAAEMRQLDREILQIIERMSRDEAALKQATELLAIHYPDAGFDIGA